MPGGNKLIIHILKNINLVLSERHGRVEYWNWKYFRKKMNSNWKNEGENFQLFI